MLDGDFFWYSEIDSDAELFSYSFRNALRATPRDFIYLSSLFGIDILIKNCSQTDSLSGYSNVIILHFTFLASQRYITKMAL